MDLASTPEDERGFELAGSTQDLNGSQTACAGALVYDWWYSLVLCGLTHRGAASKPS